MSNNDQNIVCPHCEQHFVVDSPSSNVNARIDSSPAMAAAVTRQSTQMSPVASLSTSFSRRSQRKRTARGNLLRLLGLSVCLSLVGGIIGGAIYWRQSSSPSVVEFDDSSHHAPPQKARVDAVSQLVDADKIGSQSPLLTLVENGVVRIESDRPGDQGGLGSGFVIGRDGLIATSYHVVADATRARVRFENGAVYEVAGYAAVDPDTDLAILKLQDPPPKLTAMTLRHQDEPPQLTHVVAVGHPHGIDFSTFDGTVSKVINTSQLPVHSQQFLRRLIGGRVDHRWIQHTARISEGYSGGPLLDGQGQVIGVNTWVDRKTGTGFAIHIRHLNDIMGRQFPRIAPLTAYARGNPRTTDMAKKLSATRLRTVYDEVCGMRFKPANEKDYEKLQELAWTITFANLPGALDADLRRGGLDDKHLDALVLAANEIVGSLRTQQWNGPGQVILVNDHAGLHVTRGGEGVFLFGTIQSIVSGDNGSRAALMNLAGTEQMLFLPLDGQLVDPAVGRSYLVLGVNYDGHTVRYGDNPLQPIIAPVIVSRTMLPLGEP